MKISLANKRALIGGSSKGLGNAVAKQLAISGASVTLMARNEDILRSNVDELNKLTNPDQSGLYFEKYSTFQFINTCYLLRRLCASN